MALKVGVSSCLLGNKCNFDGNDLLSAFLKKLSENDQIEFVQFCPEDFIFGTPRANLRIVGGDGNDVLDGKAVVINQNNEDVTEELIRGANQFLKQLVESEVSHAILMDGSPSCGSSVLLKEDSWPRGGFKRGSGVAAALLKRNGINVIGGFDESSISTFLKAKIKDIQFESGLKDLKDLPKFKPLF